MKKSEKENAARSERFKNVAGGLKIALDIVLVVIGIAIIAVLIFVGVRLWSGIIAPLLGQ